jgi:hypothetical protein
MNALVGKWITIGETTRIGDSDVGGIELFEDDSETKKYQMYFFDS